MITSESECKSAKEAQFDELEQCQQIEKLRYELSIALRAISNIGNKVATIQEHQHAQDGKMLIPIERNNRVFQMDRSGFLK